MAVNGVSPALAIRSSVGIELWASSGPSNPYEHKEYLPREETKNCRSISFSPDGQYFAYSNEVEIKILRTSDWGFLCALPRPKAFYLKFSPRGGYLCTWEHYIVTKDKPEGTPNMFVYEVKTGVEVFSIVQKKQIDWEPSWSSNESVFAMVAGGEALFYDLGEGVAGFQGPSKRIGGSRGAVLSLGPGSNPPFLALYTPGAKGAPSMCKLYKYPALAQNQPLACKSFFQADNVEMLWNKRGNGLLLLTSTEVDKSGASYYGNQALHFMVTKGDSCSVPLSKDGPVHSVKWSPKATEFVVVYGFMPSKASLYNLKCEVIYDFGEGPRNCAYFSPFGNIVVLAGFGNLPGNVEIWDVVAKEMIANIKCPDTTLFSWNPNGEYFLTATTAPRLRISNGFKVYHYSGALMHETMWPKGQELLTVEWQEFPEGTFTEQPITKVKQQGIKSSQPEASKKAYTPPHLRGNNNGKDKEISTSAVTEGVPGYPVQSGRKDATKPARQRYYNKSKIKKESNISGATKTIERKSLTPSASNDESSKQNDVENQHRSPDQKTLIDQRNQQGGSLQASKEVTPAGSISKKKNDRLQQNNGKDIITKSSQQKKVGSSEKEKKIRNVAKKLSDIKKLKVRQEGGEVLELNQLNKISMEAKLLEELKALKLSNS